uniref:Uncharacterized protein n=1 Tax=Arundo donax TaxID=35708 RepID=A0A0A9GMZ5_ARUDO
MINQGTQISYEIVHPDTECYGLKSHILKFNTSNLRIEDNSSVG